MALDPRRDTWVDAEADSAIPDVVDHQDSGYSPDLLPGQQQTAATVEAWLCARASRGLVVVVCHMHGGMREYHLDQIAKVDHAKRRIHLALHGMFDYQGLGLSAPRWRLQLLVPTDNVLDAACNGKTWFHGHLAYRRPLASAEERIADQLEARSHKYRRDRSNQPAG